VSEVGAIVVIVIVVLNYVFLIKMFED